MKILMPVLHYYPVIGGLEAWTQNIAERLSGKAEIFVVSGRVKNTPKTEARNGVKIFRTSLLTLTNLSHSSPFYILTALPFIFLKSFFISQRYKVNLLHCQGFMGSCIGYCLFKITGIPYITTVQRLESRNPLKVLIYINAKVCIAASSAIKKYFEEIGCKNIEVIPNGIDLRMFDGLERKPHNGFVVMTVARLEKVKGIEYLIRAFAKLNLPGRLSLVIIGDGSERKNLESLTEELGLKTKVEFLGEIPNERIPEYLAQADCFVLSSLKEGFGIAVLEAMAAGVPVVASRVGGILDIIQDGKTGLLVEAGNSQAIAEAIQEVYSGRKFIKADLEKYNWQNIANKVYENYLRYGNISA